MAYDPKPNTGTLWPNEYKKADNHPDHKGDVFLDRDLLNALMIKNPTGLIKVSISGWNKVLGGKDAISLSASEPWVKPAEDEIPY
jgi:hypothetical protein